MRIVANSQWFLDPEAWEHLGNDLLPALAESRRHLVAWSAGCFTGKEPFSLAVLLSEAQPALEWSILATDRDPSALQAVRRRGPFTGRDIENIPTEWRQRHLEGESPAYARPHLLERIEVVEHDLLRDPFPSEIDVILYRNMETCFSPEENLAIWHRFAETLTEGGIVFIGAVDRAPEPARGRFEPSGPCCYRRV